MKKISLEKEKASKARARRDMRKRMEEEEKQRKEEKRREEGECSYWPVYLNCVTVCWTFSPSLSRSQNLVTGLSQLLLRAVSLKIHKFPPSTELIQQPISNSPPQTSNSLPQTCNSLPQTCNSPPQMSNSHPQTCNSPPQMSNSLPQTSNSHPQTSNSLPQTSNSHPQMYNGPPQTYNSLTPNSSHLENSRVSLNNQWLLQTHKSCRQININHPQLLQGKRANKKICSVLTSQTLGAWRIATRGATVWLKSFSRRRK